MGLANRFFFVFSCLLIVCFCLPGCKDTSKVENAGKVIAHDVEYSIRQTHKNSYVVDVVGKIRNIGDVDVKKVVVTGFCKSCVLEFTGHRWFTSDIEKTDNQKDIISYLSVGAEEKFSFEEVAFYITHEKNPPENLPENIEVVITSFEAVD